MHHGFQISNIIEHTCPNIEKSILYSPHMSAFDLLLSSCDLAMYAYENPSLKIGKESFITYWPNQNVYSKSYSAFVSNQPLAHAKQNPASAFHLNSIIFAHDMNLITMKKEDMYLVCMNAFRPNDYLLFFPDQMNAFGCNRINRTQIRYSIPDELQIVNQNKTKTGTFCYNKNLGEDIIGLLGEGVEIIDVLPESIDKLNQQLNDFKLLIEFDPYSMVNLLCGIACGSVGVIVDPNGACNQYNDVPNLYHARSVQDLQDILRNPPEYDTTKLLPDKYRNFAQFKTLIDNIFADNQRKAFVI